RGVRPDECAEGRDGPLQRRRDRQPLPCRGAAHSGRRVRAARPVHRAGRSARGDPERHRSGSVEPRDRSGAHRDLLERGSLGEAALQGGAAAGVRPGPAGTHAALRHECAHGVPEGTGPGPRRRPARDDGGAVHLPGGRGAPLPRGTGEHRRRGPRSRRGRVHVHRSRRAPFAGRRRRAAHAVAVRAVRTHADARAALRRRARRPPGRWPEGQHHRRRERVPVRRVLAGGARPGDTPGDRRICRPDCVAKARARGHGSAVRLAPLRGAVFRAVRPRARGAVGRAFELTENAMEFVLALHSHLPYVLNHGRWPHGSDWLCEAALDTYLPLLERLEELSAEGTAAPLTIGFTPVLANQLASPAFAREMEEFFSQRLVACDEAPASFGPLVGFWRERFSRLQALFRKIDANLVAAFRRLQEQGRLEIIGSAATHGYLPLLARDESIRLQLAVGQQEHRRLFGVAPKGCWLPECAYRPRKGGRRGIEEHLADAGFRYFFTDAHLARAGTPLGAYGDIPLG